MSLVPVFVAGWPLVLGPVQVAFLELIIDPACSIVFESEDIDPRIMDRPPNRLGEPMFGPRVLTIATLQGVSSLLAAGGVYLWAVLGDRPDAVVRSATFATLVVGNLALILVNRSWHLSIWRSLRERRNPTLPWILTLGATFLVVLLNVPAARRAFHFGALRPLEWLVAVTAGLLGVAWFEVFKKRGRRVPATDGR
jgi:Ca2+-transporting ATPase